MRHLLYLSFLLLMVGCYGGKPYTGGGILVFQEETPDSFTKGCYEIVEGEVVYALYLKKNTKTTDLQVADTVIPRAFRTETPWDCERVDQAGKRTSMTLVGKDPEGNGIIILDQTFKLSDGQVFLASITDEGIQVKQLKHHFKVAGSPMTDDNFMQTASDLVVTNKEVGDFVNN